MQNKLGIPLLFITHNLEEAFLLADRVLVLHELIGLSNIFDDAMVVEYDEISRGTVLISEELKIRVNSLKLNPGDQVSWGIHPENISFLLPGSEDQDKDIYQTYVSSIISKGSKKKITLKLIRHHKTLKAEVSAQYVDSLKLNAGDSCLVKIEMSKVVVLE